VDKDQSGVIMLKVQAQFL